MRVSLSDVAKRAGVSLSTASRALNRRGSISEPVRNRVLRAARELNYYPDAIAQQLALNHRRTITLFEIGNTGRVRSPEDLQWFFGPLYETLGRKITEAGYEMNIALQRNDENHPSQVLARVRRSNNCAGIIVFIRSPLVSTVLDELVLFDVPMVSIGCSLKELQIPAIIVDNRGAAGAAAQHLIDEGFFHIAHIKGPQHQPDAEERAIGYEETLVASGMTPLTVPGGFSSEKGYNAMQRLLESERTPDAVLCANDFAAIGARRAIQERGLAIPNDIALFGFDDIPVSRFLTPSLSTVRQPQERMGSEAGRVILDSLAGQPSSEDLYLPCELVVRESSLR